MSEPVLKQRPTIDLDDFERRLRQAAAAPAGARRDDPLAELARLVGEPYDPLGDVFAQDARPGHHAGQEHYAAPDHDAMSHAMSREPGYAPGVPRLFGDFAAIEAGLRGAGHHPQSGSAADRAEAAYVQAGQLALDGEGEWAGVATGESRLAQGYADPQPYRGDRALMRRPMVLMAASIAIGVFGIGAAFALKGRVASSPREVKTIMADTAPIKVQPPPDAAGDPGTDAGFGKGNGTQPTRLVSREEQPVDITQAVQDNVARAAQMNPATDAASVPVPPSPGQKPGGDAIGAQVQGFGLAEMPAPKRVRVVSVRPDGTILPGDAGAPAPRQAPAATGDRAGPVARAATPKVAPGKVTSRVAAKAAGDKSAGDKSAGDRATEEKTIDQVAAEGDDAAKETAKSPRKGKPQRVASADAGDAAAEPAAVSDGSGGFAVQLAAPASESDAKAASTRLSKKFSETLGGRHIAVRKAESNGKSVYRVRVSSLSRADAVGLCEKLKADGGSCFVAKN